MYFAPKYPRWYRSWARYQVEAPRSKVPSTSKKAATRVSVTFPVYPKTARDRTASTETAAVLDPGPHPKKLCARPPGPGTHTSLLLVATLMASLAKQFAVLLFRHTLAAFLDDGTHADLLNHISLR